MVLSSLYLSMYFTTLIHEMGSTKEGYNNIHGKITGQGFVGKEKGVNYNFVTDRRSREGPVRVYYCFTFNGFLHFD